MGADVAPGWALVAAGAFAGIAFLALVGLIVVLTLWWRGRPRTAPVRPEPDAGTTIPDATGSADGDPALVGKEPPAEPAAPAPTTAPDTRVVADAVRTAILQAVAERCPAGWTALALSPPPNPRRMTWHLHLEADVALDLVDGRTIPAAPPAASHEWKLPSGRAARLAFGDPAPPPGPETRVVRVTGPYLSVTRDGEAPGRILVRLTAGPDAHHEYRADADDPGALGTMLAQALSGAISGPRGVESTAMGYSPASWRAHERAWLHVLGH